NAHTDDEVDFDSSYLDADHTKYAYYLTPDEVFKALTTLTPDKFGKIWIHYALNGVETDAPVGISLANMSINIPVEVEFSSSSHKYESGTSASSYEQATVTVKDGSTEGNHTFDIDLTSDDYSIKPTDSDAADTYKYTLSASGIQKVNAAITAYARDTTSGSFQDVVNVSTGQALINYSYQLSNSSATGTINITNTSPTISANNQSVKYGDPDSLLDIIGATANDIEDGNLTNSITITNDGGYNAMVASTYTITLSVTDAAGATTTKTATVTVQPNTVPTLTVTNKTTTFGNSTSLLSILGATATDTEDGDLTSGITITDDGGYNATVAGTYTVTLAVTDSGGATTTATATVTVQPDGIPTITATDKTTNFGTTTSLLELIGATASDAEDGNLTQQVTITNDGGYSATTPGTYTVTLAVTDSAGATATTTVRVTVPAQPNQAPQLNVTNQTTTFGNPASLLTTLGATATDAEDGDLTNAITVTDDGGYNAQVAGTYTVTLSVTDSAGTTTTKSTNITVQADTTASSVATSSAASVASSSATTKSDAPAGGSSTAPSQAEPAGSVAVQPAANAVGTAVIAVYTDNNVPDTIIRVSGPVGEPVMPSKTAILGAYFQDGFGIGSNDITPDTTFAAQPQQFTIRMRSARSQLELPPQRPHVFNLTVQRPVPIKKEATTTPITRHQPIIFDWQRNLLHMSPARGSDGEHSVVGRYLQSLSGRIFFGTRTQG
uniref:immunoglobulin-like domain-containing protein n=1 Tax=uncultured Lacticaseibacillus sp. TaxID=2775882 RepID=UPI002596731A